MQQDHKGASIGDLPPTENPQPLRGSGTTTDPEINQELVLIKLESACAQAFTSESEELRFYREARPVIISLIKRREAEVDQCLRTISGLKSSLSDRSAQVLSQEANMHETVSELNV